VIELDLVDIRAVFLNAFERHRLYCAQIWGGPLRELTPRKA
jgi:hypothetical protein